MTPNPYSYRATVLNVVDGDSVDLMIDLGFDMRLRERVRLAGVDAPEIRTKDLREKHHGLRAKARLEAMLDIDQEVMIRTEYERGGKYGRTIAHIYLPTSEQSVGEALLAEALVVPYDGKSSRKAIRAAHVANWDAIEGVPPAETASA